MPDMMETWKIVYSYKNFTHININNNIIININNTPFFTQYL